MGAITISVDAGAAGQASKSYTVSNADIGRLIAWAKVQYFPRFAQPAPTDLQALAAWADALIQQTKDNVVEHERRAASVPAFVATEA